MSQSTSKIIAICLSDIHLSITPPIARASEKSWLDAMRRPLEEVKFLQKSLNVPVLCAGDIFHHWKSPPELINFAMDALPFMYAIPGQHDLPLHDFGQVKKSAYWTLEKAGRIQTVTPVGLGLHDFVVYGFPWGVPIVPPHQSNPCGIDIALIHKYVWIENCGYTGAPEEAKLTGPISFPYRVSVIGDNHKSFSRTEQGVIELPPKPNSLTIGHKGDGIFKSVINCGGFYRRNSDEVSRRPRVGLIHADGSVESHELDCSQDVITPQTVMGLSKGSNEQLADFLDELKDMQGAVLDYPKALRQAMQKANPEVKKLLLEALDVK